MLLAWRTHDTEQKGFALRLMLVGTLARLMLFPVAPYTSNDFERYLWDGRVAIEGLDPYTVVPDDPLLADLRTVWATPPEHAAIPTLYPPAALASFSLAAWAGPMGAIWVWKGLCTLASILVLWLSARLLRSRNRSEHLALVALSPLLVFESGIGAHVDVFSTLCVVVTLLAADSRQWSKAGVAIGLGALFKLLPVILLVPMLSWPRSISGTARAVGAAGLTLFAGYAAAFAIGLRPIGSSFYFFEHWRFGGVVFPLLDRLPLAALLGTLLALLGIALLFSLKLARDDYPRAVQIALAAPLALSPVLFPWYLSPLVPVLALAPSGLLLGWVSAVPLTYEVLDGFLSTGDWTPAGWPLGGIGLAVAAGSIWDRRGRSRHKERHEGPERTLQA